MCTTVKYTKDNAEEKKSGSSATSLRCKFGCDARDIDKTLKLTQFVD